jgi:hypothetical protein
LPTTFATLTTTNSATSATNIPQPSAIAEIIQFTNTAHNPTNNTDNTNVSRLFASEQGRGVDLLKLTATSLPATDDSADAALHTCEAHAEAALANWRHFCKTPLVVFERFCWSRAPSLEKCCDMLEGKKPLRTCREFLPEFGGGCLGGKFEIWAGEQKIGRKDDEMMGRGRIQEMERI